MKLSLFTLTRNSAPYIEELLQVARGFADEIVVAVDSSSTDSTEEICGAYADKLFRVGLPGHPEPALAWIIQQCSGDWVLRLDDDELPSAGLVAGLPDLMQDREMTHYWVRERWVVRDDPLRWISQPPWWPDWKLRLFRNVPSIIHIPTGLHTSISVEGAARYFYEGSIYHFDFVYHDRRQRLKKVQGYEFISPDKSGGHFYLPEESHLETLPVPHDDPPLKPGESSSRRAPAVRAVEVESAEIRSVDIQPRDYGAELFRAHLECVGCPQVMVADGWRRADLELRNESPHAWPLSGAGEPEVRVAYRWLKPDEELYDQRGRRTGLPHTLRPGETTRLPALVRAPKEPGDYILQWDLVVPQVGWFSKRGWQGPEVEVRVVNE